MEGCAETYGRPVFSSSGRSFLRLLLLGLAFLAGSLLLCPSCAGSEFASTSTYVLIYIGFEGWR